MIYLEIGMTILMQCAAFLYLKMLDVESEKEKKKRRLLIFWVSIGLTIMVGIIAQKKSENLVEYIKMITLYQILFCAAVVDARKKIIPDFLLLVGMCIRVFFYAIEFALLRFSWKEWIMKDFFGVLVGSGILFLVYLISKDAIGLGDVKLFGVIGCYQGFVRTYSILFLSVLLTTIAAVFLICVKKEKRNYSVAFAPFVFVSYIISIMFL